MSSALIVDPLQNFPSATLLFEKSDYVAAPSLWGRDKLHSEPFFKERYGIDVCPIEEAKTDYDILCLVMDFPFINQDFLGEWGGSEPIGNKESHDTWGNILLKLSHINFKKIIIIDYSDFPLCSRSFDVFTNDYQINIDAVFKREHRFTCSFDYNDKVHPFPFVVFGKIDPTWLLYKERLRPSNLHNRPPICVWASQVILRSAHDDVFRLTNRYDFFKEIMKEPLLDPRWKDRVIGISGVPLEEFQKVFSEGKFALHLNGSGHLCKVFFESLSAGVLLMQQLMHINFPFKEKFDENTLFYSNEEFIQNHDRLKNNPSLYDKALLKQNKIIDKYFNPTWINKYIHSKI